MNRSPDADDVVGIDTGSRRFAAALVGLILGQLAGDKSVTIAKVFLYFDDGQFYERQAVAEASLHVIFIVAGVGAFFGCLAAKRKWVSIEQVVTSVSIAVVVAFFAIVDYSLPVATDDSQLPFKQPMYYLGWVFGLWFAPFVFLPNQDGTFQGWVRRGGGVLAVAATMAVACFLVGVSLERAVRLIGGLGWLDDGFYLNDTLRFWVARPGTVNAVCGSYVVVAFASIWWRGLQWSKTRAYTWTLGMTAFVIAYAGLYGWGFYAPVDHPARWQFFFAFGTLPAAAAITVFLAYAMTRRDDAGGSVGWPVSARFWLLLPMGFAVGFAISALLGLAPLAEGATDKQIFVLVVAHCINGVVLGLNLRLMALAFRLIPDGQVTSRPIST